MQSTAKYAAININCSSPGLFKLAIPVPGSILAARGRTSNGQRSYKYSAAGMAMTKVTHPTLAVSSLDDQAVMLSRSGPPSCHHTSSSSQHTGQGALQFVIVPPRSSNSGGDARRSGIVSSRFVFTSHAGPRLGVKPSCTYSFFQLLTHRSRSLAIQNHAITRFCVGAQVAGIEGPAFSHRTSP